MILEEGAMLVWQGRAEQAEADVERLRRRVQELEVSVRGLVEENDKLTVILGEARKSISHRIDLDIPGIAPAIVTDEVLVEMNDGIVAAVPSVCTSKTDMKLTSCETSGNEEGVSDGSFVVRGSREGRSTGLGHDHAPARGPEEAGTYYCAACKDTGCSECDSAWESPEGRDARLRTANPQQKRVVPHGGPRAHLECDHCGDVAIWGDSNGTFLDGSGDRCIGCGHPGSVVCDAETEASWSASDDALAFCALADCAECEERRDAKRSAEIEKLKSELEQVTTAMLNDTEITFERSAEPGRDLELIEEWERQYLWAVDKLRWALGVVRTWDVLNPAAGTPDLADGSFMRGMIDEVLAKTVPRAPRTETPSPGLTEVEVKPLLEYAKFRAVRAIAEWMRAGADGAVFGDARDRVSAETCEALSDAILRRFAPDEKGAGVK